MRDNGRELYECELCERELSERELCECDLFDCELLACELLLRARVAPRRNAMKEDRIRLKNKNPTQRCGEKMPPYAA